MNRSSASRRRLSTSRASRATPDCLNVLTADEAQAVFREVLSARPEVVADVRRAAGRLLASVSCSDVDRRVFRVLQALDIDGLKIGLRVGGYVEPNEVAWQMIEESVEPFFVDLQRRLKLRHEDEALKVCRGIVAGLYRAAQHRFDVLEDADDCPSETASRTLRLWRRGRKTADLGRDFVEKHAPEWDWLVG